MADSSLIGSAVTDLGKIRSLLERINGLKDFSINISNLDTITNDVNNLKSQLEGLCDKHWNIDLTINDSNANNTIQNIRDNLDTLNNQNNRRNRGNSRRRNRNTQSRMPQGASFPVSRRKWAQKYRDVANAEEQQIIQSLIGKGSTLLSANGRQRYDKTGKEVGANWIVTYRNELGKTVKTMLSYNKEADKWSVTGTSINANYQAQEKELEKVQNYLNQQQNAYRNLEDAAFKSKGSFDRNSPFGKEALKALGEYDTEIQALRNGQKQYNADERRQLDNLRQNAKRVIAQQKELKRQEDATTSKQKRDADYNSEFISKQDISREKLESVAFKQSNPLSGGFKDEADKAIKYWKDKVDEARSYTGKLTQEQENTIKEAEAAAKRSVTEQQKAQWQADKLRAKSVDEKKSNANWGLDIQVEKLKQAGQYTEETEQKIENLKKSLEGVKDQKGFDEWSKQLEKFNQELTLSQEKAKTLLKQDNFQATTKVLSNQLTNLKKKYDEIIQANPSKASSDIEDLFGKLQTEVENLRPEKVSNFRKELQMLRTEVNGLQPQTLSKVLSENFGGLGQYLSRFTSSVFLIQKGIQVAKKMVAEVTSVDSSLVELQKVTTLSGDSLDQFVDKAYKVGEGLGRTGKDVVDAVTTFSRAGYDLNEATQLAESALVMSNVGVDIPNMDAAASDMISILKAFDKQANESMQVIDELYNVANKEPLDFGNITQMLVTAGGTLAQTGTSLEESMGLLTGAFATLRDTSVANGLIMISQRLRGVKEDGEAIEEAGFMPKLKKAFGEVGVAIEDENGELRSTFDILNDLAGVWDQLSSKQKQFLGEKAAGNRQVKTLNAIMANWDVVKDTIDKANEASDMATEGNQQYLDSIQGRITAFQSAFQNLSKTTINSGLVKNVVSLGTAFVNLATKMGGLVPVTLAVVGAFKAFASASSLGAFFSIVGVIAAIVSYAKSAGSSFDQMKAKVNDASKSYSDQQNKVISLNEKLEETQRLIDELESKDSLTVVEESELSRLKDLNKELQTNIALEKEKLKIEERGKINTSAEEYSRWLKTDTSRDGRYDSVDYDIQTDALLSIAQQKGKQYAADFVKFTIDSLSQLGVILQPQNNQERLNNARISAEFSKSMMDKNQARIDKIYASGRLNSDDEEVKKQAEDQLKLARAYRDYYKVTFQQAIAELNDYSDQLADLIGDTQYIENPETQSEKAMQHMQNTKKAIDDFIITNTFDSLDSVTDYITSKYTDQFDRIKDIIEHNGEISYESLIANFPEVISEFEKYGAAFGITANNVARHINETLSASSKEGQGIGIMSSVLDELIDKNFMASGSYKTLSKAMTEQEKAGVISMETYKALMDDAGLPGIQNYLTLTAEGFALNTEKMYDYIKAMNDEMKVKILDELAEKQAALEKLKEAMEGMTDEEKAMSKEASEAEKIQNDITALQAYVNSLDSATGALERYRAAKKTANEDEDYTEGQGALKDLKTGWKSGKTGTDDYQSAMGFFLANYGSDPNLKGKAGYKAAQKVGNRYFADEKKGANNFLTDLKKLSKSDLDVASKLKFSKDGKSLEIADDTSIQEIAQGLSEVTGNAEMSEDAITSLFKLLKTYDEDNTLTFPWLTPPSDPETDAQRKALETSKSQTQDELDKLTQQREELLAGGANVSSPEIKEIDQQIEQASQAVKVLDEQLGELGSDTSFELDTSSIDELQKKLESIQATIAWLRTQGAGDIPLSLSGTATKVLEELDRRIKELETGPNIVDITAKDKTLEGVQSAEQHVNGIKQKTPVYVKFESTDALLDVLEVQAALDSVKQTDEDGPDINVDTEPAEVAVDEVRTDIEGLGDTIPAPIDANPDPAKGKIEELRVDVGDFVDAVTGADPVLEADATNAEQEINDATDKANAFDALMPHIELGVSVIAGSFATVENAIDQWLESVKNKVSQWIESVKGLFPSGGSEPLKPLEPTPSENGGEPTQLTQGDISNIKTRVGEMSPSGIGVDEDYNKLIEAAKQLELAQQNLDNADSMDASSVQQASDELAIAASDFITAYNNVAATLGDVQVLVDADEAMTKVQNLAALASKEETKVIHVVYDDGSGNENTDEGNGPFGYMPTVVDVPLEAENPEGVVDAAQAAADSNPVEITVEMGSTTVDNLEPAVSQLSERGNALGYTDEVNELTSAYEQLKTAQSQLNSTDPGDTDAYASASQELVEASTNFQTAYDNLSNALVGLPDVQVDADTTNALSKVKELVDSANTTATLTVKIQTEGEIPQAAKGTSFAKQGPSLVDEKGAELIEHTKRGTYELGTNKGARMTYLDRGDVVHTASETKTILSRMAKVGGFFRDGLNKSKAVIGGAFARGISGSISLDNIRRVLGSSRSKVSGNNSSNSNKGSKKNAKKFQSWAEKLFDWAEIRLARLQTITNGWLLSASEAIGYIAKNKELTNAIASVEDQIEATTKAYDLYMKEADIVQKKAGLSDAIVKKIQSGDISIGSYKKEVQEKIKQYEEWYNKALNCADALNDLREQEKELAKQKLDNVITHYTNRINRLENIVRQRESELALAAAQGKELQAKEYDESIAATTEKLDNLVKEYTTLKQEMADLMAQGLIEKESDDWFEYTGKIEDVANAITETKTAIIELQDTANEVRLTKLGYELDALTSRADRMNDLMDLHASQVTEETNDTYKDLIENGMEQIKNLETQNEKLREQQKGLDILSEKYQELESQIQSNISTINQMKVSQEQWNDSVLDLKIAQLEKYRDSLSKTNDQYQRQKELHEAIEELQKAQSQRTQRVYKEGIGFVYEADQDALKSAQENLEDVIENQLLSRIDDLIDALEEEKNNTNVYDYEGNLLGTQYSLPQLGTLTEILSSYYSSNTVPGFSGLKGSLYDQIVAGATNNKSMQFNFGDINLSEVNDVNTLGEAIIDLLPNAILQAMNKRS